MPTLTAFIRTTQKDKPATIRFRLTDGRDTQLFGKTNLKIIPKFWDKKKECVKTNIVFNNQERAKITSELATLRNIILTAYEKDKKSGTEIGRTYLDNLLDTYYNKDKNDEQARCADFFENLNLYIETSLSSKTRIANFKVLYRILKRFEAYKSITTGGKYKLTFNNMDYTTLASFHKYIFDEHKIIDVYPQLLEIVPESRRPQPRGHNTAVLLLKKLRTFILHARKIGICDINPFESYHIGEEIYGTPFFLSQEERMTLYNTDLGNGTQVAIQRDIYIFQGMIGCRVSDLYKLRPENIIDGFVVYVASKTKEKSGQTIRVPLNRIAMEIVERYKDNGTGMLFPFINKQDYNDYIKEALTKAGITRNVLVLDPLTMQEKIRPINEVASSHMARRDFVGNMYKKVKDPNLIGSMTGHTEGSRAFRRYREITDDIKTDLVKLLEPEL